MTVAVWRIVTDFDEREPSPETVRVLQSAKLRKDGQPDLRTKAGKIARMAIDADLLRSHPHL